MAKKQEALQVLAPNFRALTVEIKGTEPGLMMHRFSEKAKRQMLEKQMATSRVKKKREPKNPEQDFLGALYVIDKNGKRYDETNVKKLTKSTRYGFPANGFKRAMVSACRVTEGLSMAEAKQLFFVVGDFADLVEIKTPNPPEMCEDVVKIAMNTTDLRYRPLFETWGATLRVEYDADRVTANDIINLLRKAGMQVGVGERRPEKEGNTYGRWTVSEKGIKDEAIE